MIMILTEIFAKEADLYEKGLTNKGLRNIIRFSIIQGVNKYAARYS